MPQKIGNSRSRTCCFKLLFHEIFVVIIKKNLISFYFILERKMAEEEELRRRKEEMVSVFLKMKLSREEQKSGLNSSKLIDHWRGTRREIKTKELQSEMSVQKDAFERALLKKNRHIELLLQVWYQPELSKHYYLYL